MLQCVDAVYYGLQDSSEADERARLVAGFEQLIAAHLLDLLGISEHCDVKDSLSMLTLSMPTALIANHLLQSDVLDVRRAAAESIAKWISSAPDV